MRFPKRLRHYVPPKDERQLELLDLNPQGKLFEWRPARPWEREAAPKIAKREPRPEVGTSLPDRGRPHLLKAATAAFDALQSPADKKRVN